MKNQQFHQITRAFAVILTSIGLMSYPVLGRAQSHNSNTSNSLPIRFNEQQPDGSGRGRPGRRGGTGSRGECPSAEVQLTALIPSSNFGFSIDPHPTLWFYIPYKSNEVVGGEFSLQDEQNNDVYRASFTLPEAPGIVSLNLASGGDLEINKKYQWYVKIYCTRQNLSIPIFIRGWLQKLALKPDIERQLKIATTPRERIAIYAQNGIWYSALTELAKLRIAEPQNVTVNDDWTNLLKDVGLEKLAQKPIVGELIIQPSQ